MLSHVRFDRGHEIRRRWWSSRPSGQTRVRLFRLRRGLFRRMSFRAPILVLKHGERRWSPLETAPFIAVESGDRLRPLADVRANVDGRFSMVRIDWLSVRDAPCRSRRHCVRAARDRVAPRHAGAPRPHRAETLGQINPEAHGRHRI